MALTRKIAMMTAARNAGDYEYEDDDGEVDNDDVDECGGYGDDDGDDDVDDSDNMAMFVAVFKATTEVHATMAMTTMGTMTAVSTRMTAIIATVMSNKLMMAMTTTPPR